VHTIESTAKPLLEIAIGSRTFLALIDTGSSVSLVGHRAHDAAIAAGTTASTCRVSLQLASGWTTSDSYLQISVAFQGGRVHQAFLSLPTLSHDVVLGRDFLAITGMVLDIRRGVWAIGSVMGQFRVPVVQELAAQAIVHTNVINPITEHPQVPNQAPLPLPPLLHHIEDLPPLLQPKAALLLSTFEDMFTSVPGLTSVAEHTIDTGSAAPIRCRLRPVNDTKRAILDGEIDALLAQGLIRPSTSQWASAPVLVPKKTGGHRLAIDYRRLNNLTTAPTWPMPRTDWLLAQVGRAKWFSTIDLSQGFFQIRRHEGRLQNCLPDPPGFL
jgi:Retroviral aspartyl protease